MDLRFCVNVLEATLRPQLLIYTAMHQDYAEECVGVDRPVMSESSAGYLAVKRLLAGDRGHFGCLEHPQISFSCGFFPHSVMQQARTHRVGISFDVQSMRYTGRRVCDVADGDVDWEDVFYLRPAGDYRDRQGKHYTYSDSQRQADAAMCCLAAVRYRDALLAGLAEEQARGMLPFDFRQHFVVSFTLRSVLHFMDLRAKLDAQDEIRALCELMWPHVREWVPQIAAWYEANRMRKARLAP